MYIIKKIIKTNEEVVLPVEANEIITFLVGIDSKTLKYNELFLVENFKDEINDFLVFFNDDFLIKQEHSFFGEVYYINKAIPKNKITKKASPLAIKRFIKKIKNKINFEFEDILIDFEFTYFHITIKKFGSNKTDLLIRCSYNLEIESATALILVDDKNFSVGAVVTFDEMQKVNQLLNIVNNIFRNQRYYYRRKERESIF